MKYLLDAAREYGLDQITEQALEYPNVHGVIVDLHPFWMKCYKRHLMFPNEDSDLRYWLDPRYWYDYIRHGVMPPAINSIWHDDYYPYFQTTVPMNIRWRPDHWKEFLGNRSNLVVRIQLLPGSPSIRFEQKDNRVTIMQEYSAIPQLSTSDRKQLRPLEGGVSIGHETTPAGTLGGILVDQKGERYGLTCGHVISKKDDTVDQPSRNEKKPSGSIGRCVYTILPKPNNGAKCNPQNRAVLNDLDIALIHLEPDLPSNYSIVNIGKIVKHTPSIELGTDMLIEFNGRTSGHKTLVIGGIGATQQIANATGETCCFKNLIEIKQPVLTDLLISRPVSGGDSGAWVIVNGNSGLEWCGMIVGENRQSGYAIHSEDIMANLESQGFQLSCS